MREVYITTIDEEFEKADREFRMIRPEGHKAYTRVRRGKLERIPQKGVGKKEFEGKSFKEYLRPAIMAYKTAFVDKVVSDLKGAGFSNIVTDDSWSDSSDLGSVSFTADYKDKSIYGAFSHQGHTMYVSVYKHGKAGSAGDATSRKDKDRLNENVPAQSVTILKKKLEKIK